jgi:hypothetical protein
MALRLSTPMMGRRMNPYSGLTRLSGFEGWEGFQW